jgi:phospholipid/cholesterol/gamma-HCH transport system substrate-binding protein
MRRLALIATLLLAAATLAIVGTGSSNGAQKVYYVRAIFDNAAFAVPGEDVRIAGAPVGSIQSLDVCTSSQAPCPQATPENKAAVTLAITKQDFTPFYANATCSIRPQSLIAERYVDCLPGNSNNPPLEKITSGAGSGSYLLPVTRTSSPIDSDILQDISQESIRQRFSIILDELGTALAARGSDLNAVIHRANPALGYTDQVLKILAGENRTLAQLATDSDAVLKPLANARQQLADFIVQANTTAVASAARANDIEESFRLFPQFLQQLDPLMVDLGKLADQGTPLMASLRQSAAALGRQFQNLAPFAKVSLPALIDLGNSSQQSQPALVATEPLARRLLKLGNTGLPPATLLDKLLTSIDNTGGFEDLMGVLFNGVAASNGFDSIGHYTRDEPLVGDCTGYAIKPVSGCEATFGAGTTASARSLTALATAATARTQKASAAQSAASRAVVPVVRQAVNHAQSQRRSITLASLLRYLVGSG